MGKMQIYSLDKNPHIYRGEAARKVAVGRGKVEFLALD
jgi:hypothetical protein